MFMREPPIRVGSGDPAQIFPEIGPWFKRFNTPFVVIPQLTLFSAWRNNRRRRKKPMNIQVKASAWDG
jgi:hypothetical protein